MDAELCEALRIPMCMLPKPVSNSEEYGTIDSHMPGLEELSGTPICGAAGDQQAALLGQGCIHPGEAKNTYGTGCFAMMNTGPTVPVSRSGLLSCVAWSIRGETNYCLEGSVFNAGSTVQWMRDELHLISSAEETQALAESVPGQRRRVSCLGVHRSRRAVTDNVRARHARRHHPWDDARARCPRGT